MLFYSIPLILLTGLYAVTLLILRNGFLKLNSGENKTQLKVSVIIAARNEENNIATCLNAVVKQSYPKHKLEIIVIDDRSEDRTADIVEQLANVHRQIKLHKIQDTSAQLTPKKRAIDIGVRHATGEIIVTTDADCQPGPNWITGLVKYFEPEVGLVAGYSPYRKVSSKNPVFQQMLAMDFFSLACVSAASAGLNFPVSCSGANLAYRKKLYSQLGGFKHIGNWVSGDDDFFLEQARKKTDWKIRYAIEPKTHVPTAPPENFKEFCHQRIRYASKGRHYKLPVTAILIGIYILNLLFLIGPIICLFNMAAAPFWLFCLMTKAIVERLFLISGQKIFKLKFSIFCFILTFLLHPFYIVMAGFLGQFAAFNWKGEKFSGKVNNEYHNY